MCFKTFVKITTIVYKRDLQLSVRGKNFKIKLNVFSVECKKEQNETVYNLDDFYYFYLRINK